jgi:hypothetical protein
MSRLTSLIRKPFVPTLPIEIWFKAKPFFRWRVKKDGDDWVLECGWPFPTPYGSRMPLPAQLVRSLGRDYEGKEYVADLLKIREPQDLAAFMNLNGNPLDEVVQHPIGEEYHRAQIPFYWSDFVRVQQKLRDAMLLSLDRLSHHPEFKWAFTLSEFSVAVIQKASRHYGIVRTRPSIPWCYRVIAINRLLGNVEYKFCLRCGNPFSVESRHKRKYCPLPAPCGHAVAQEAYRIRKRKSEMRQRKSKKRQN